MWLGKSSIGGSEDQSTMATVAFISHSDFTLAKGTNQAVTPIWHKALRGNGAVITDTRVEQMKTVRSGDSLWPLKLWHPDYGPQQRKVAQNIKKKNKSWMTQRRSTITRAGLREPGSCKGSGLDPHGPHYPGQPAPLHAIVPLPKWFLLLHTEMPTGATLHRYSSVSFKHSKLTRAIVKTHSHASLYWEQCV